MWERTCIYLNDTRAKTALDQKPYPLPPLSASAEPKELKRPISVCSRSSNISSISFNATVKVSLCGWSALTNCQDVEKEKWGRRGGRQEREGKQAGELYTENKKRKKCPALSWVDAGGMARVALGTKGSSFAYRGNCHSQGPSALSMMKSIVRLPFCKSAVLRLSPPLPPYPNGCLESNSQDQGTRWPGWGCVSKVRAATKRNHSAKLP